MDDDVTVLVKISRINSFRYRESAPVRLDYRQSWLAVTFASLHSRDFPLDTIHTISNMIVDLQKGIAPTRTSENGKHSRLLAQNVTRAAQGSPNVVKVQRKGEIVAPVQPLEDKQMIDGECLNHTAAKRTLEEIPGMARHKTESLPHLDARGKVTRLVGIAEGVHEVVHGITALGNVSIAKGPTFTFGNLQENPNHGLGRVLKVYFFELGKGREERNYDICKGWILIEDLVVPEEFEAVNVGKKH